MASRTFRLEATVAATPERVVDFLLQLDAHRGIHAYLESARPVDSGTDAEGEWVDWRVVERPKAGPFRYRIRFPARMTRTGPGAMVGRVRAIPGCTLETRTSAAVDGDGTLVSETTVVTAPVFLVRYMARHAQLAHARTFAALPRELEEPPPPRPAGIR